MRAKHDLYVIGLINADEGAVMLDGEDVTKMHLMNALVGDYLPKASIFRGLTVEQNIRAVLEILKSMPISEMPCLKI